MAHASRRLPLPRLTVGEAALSERYCQGNTGTERKPFFTWMLCLRPLLFWLPSQPRTDNHIRIFPASSSCFFSCSFSLIIITSLLSQSFLLLSSFFQPLFQSGQFLFQLVPVIFHPFLFLFCGEETTERRATATAAATGACL